MKVIHDVTINTGYHLLSHQIRLHRIPNTIAATMKLLLFFFFALLAVATAWASAAADPNPSGVIVAGPAGVVAGGVVPGAVVVG